MLAPRTILTASTLGLGLGLGLTTLTLTPKLRSPLQCQYSAGPPDPTWTVNGSPTSSDPILRKQGTRTSTTSSGLLTASNMQQISLGSVLGLVVGVGLRAFSRTLVVLLGLGIVVVEWAASKGYNLLPLDKVQKYVKGVDVQKAVSHRVPFKISFGVTMGLAAFAQF
ncbi:hypothetical protein BO70DRAFT_103482 [Aspergillus heteromorphus CBS 117.55]|uniref:FUN14-domain-containing protein n=1 Tax=Aspergillus heteromorphus CBS 117.55 TaxID=1448321 RepID=A0A317VQJ1_9EURO|nr:uncharacterized protein BO70DRAFT_103482 [Aspergillus heteromorphus CBS 117.55]PWY75178.1 hypothetical protein BO70DRAFT_103482 [Aspergillus heteromorphus CBS 117.55]